MPLPLPCFHSTEWVKNQTFAAEDDPDRTQQPWEPPAFVRIDDPKKQHVKMKVEEICFQNTPVLHSSSSFARIVHGVLDADQCFELIQSVNNKGFTPALLNIGHGRQKVSPSTRDGHRVIVDSPELTIWLLEALRPHIPEVFRQAELVDLNERCRFLLYNPAQKFVPHRDANYRRPQGQPNAGDRSQVTIQLYLNDLPEEAGGATRFMGRKDSRTLPGPKCQPGAGSVLLFSQDLYHEGSELIAGLKYTMRTEAMYRKQATQ